MSNSISNALASTTERLMKSYIMDPKLTTLNKMIIKTISFSDNRFNKTTTGKYFLDLPSYSGK